MLAIVPKRDGVFGSRSDRAIERILLSNPAIDAEDEAFACLLLSWGLLPLMAVKEYLRHFSSHVLVEELSRHPNDVGDDPNTDRDVVDQVFRFVATLPRNHSSHPKRWKNHEKCGDLPRGAP